MAEVAGWVHVQVDSRSYMREVMNLSVELVDTLDEDSVRRERRRRCWGRWWAGWRAGAAKRPAGGKEAGRHEGASAAQGRCWPAAHACWCAGAEREGRAASRLVASDPGWGPPCMGGCLQGKGKDLDPLSYTTEDAAAAPAAPPVRPAAPSV